MHPRKRLSIKSATVAGIAASALLGLAGLTLNPAPAKAVVYCQYVELSCRLRGEGRRRAQASSGGTCCGPS